MACRNSGGSFSLSGLPAEMVGQMENLAKERRMSLKHLYSEAAEDLMRAVNAGEISGDDWVDTIGGSSRKTIWVYPEVAVEVDVLRRTLKRKRSSFMLTAIRRFLGREGRLEDF